MPFDWSRYLTLAEELGQRTDEASLRTALSRAYYYVYHLALERAERNNFQRLPGESSHSQLWRVFSGSPESVCQRLAVIAERLKEKRERADHNASYARLAEEIPEILADARDFASLLRGLHSRFPSPKSQRR